MLQVSFSREGGWGIAGWGRLGSVACDSRQVTRDCGTVQQLQVLSVSGGVAGICEAFAPQIVCEITRWGASAGLLY